MTVTTEALRSLRALAVVLLLISDVSAAATQRVTIRTDDGVSLAGTWYEPGARTAPAVILIHMLNRSRRDWDGVASRLAAEGIGALAIDLRGHGDSGGAPGGGDPPDYSGMVRDVSAARRYLASRGDVLPSRIGVAGASIGASLAVLEASGDSSVVSLALLSPSVDYRGLRIEAAFRKLGDRPVLLISSDDDPYATRSVRDLRKMPGGTREVVLLNRAGHGTVMLGRDAELTRTLVDWFRRTLL